MGLNTVARHGRPLDIEWQPDGVASKCDLSSNRAVIAKNVLVWMSGQLGASLQEYVTRDLRNAVYRHLARLPLGYFTRTKAGQILSRVVNDTYETRLILTQIVTQSLQAGAMLLASIAFLVAISWQLTLLALVTAPILSLVLQPLLKKLRKGNRRRGHQHGEMTSVLQETMSGIRLVKSFSAEPYEEQRFTPRAICMPRAPFGLPVSLTLRRRLLK